MRAFTIDLNFHNSSFALLRYFLTEMARPQCDTPLVILIGRVSSSKQTLLAPSQTWDRSIVRTPVQSVKNKKKLMKFSSEIYWETFVATLAFKHQGVPIWFAPPLVLLARSNGFKI
jgi:hypothetical protein